MADENNAGGQQPTAGEGGQTPNPNPEAGKSPQGGDKDHSDNIAKALDEEREKRKAAEAEANRLRTEDEERKKKEKENKLKEEGKYQEALADKDKQIETLTAREQKLAELEKEAADKNAADLELFKDPDQKTIVETTIAGKDPIEQRKLIKLLKKQFLSADPKSKGFGGKTPANPSEREAKSSDLASLKKEFDGLIAKTKSGVVLNADERDKLKSLPKEMKRLQAELDSQGK